MQQGSEPTAAYTAASEAALTDGRPSDPQLATSEADDAGGMNAVVTVGSETLLLLWRGYANPALRTRPTPRFEVARGLSAETLSVLLLASGETAVCNVDSRRAGHGARAL